MDAPESNRSRSTKRDAEDRTDARDSRVEDDERRDHSDKRKHRSNKSWKHNEEESEEHDNKRRNSGDRNDSRRKSGGSSRANSGDEDDYDTRRDSRSKIPRKDPEERGEPRSSEGHRERDLDGSRKGRDDEHESNSSKKTGTRPSGHESSQSRTRSRAESSHDGELEKLLDKDSRSADRKESGREKGHEHREEERNPRGRTSETSYIDRYDPKNGKSSDNDKHETTRDRTLDSRNEYGEAKSREERRFADSRGEKDVMSSSMEEKTADGERSRNRGRSEAQDEHTRAAAQPREARSDGVRDDRQKKVRERSVGLAEDAEHSARSPGKKGEKHRQQRGSAHGSRVEVESKERYAEYEREVRRNRRSRTPERSGRHHREVDEHDRGSAEHEKERNMGTKGKEWEDNYKDDKNKEREGSKDHRKTTYSRQDAKDVDKEFGDSQKREQERAGYRKDSRIRPEGVKPSSSFGNINEHSDSIEIKLKNSNFGREESVRRTEAGSQQDFSSGASDEEWGYPPEDRGKMVYTYGDDSQEPFQDEGSPLDQNSGRANGRGQKRGMNSSRTGAGQSSGSGSQLTTFGTIQGSGSFNRVPQGPKGGRPARGGRRMTGRDAQRVGIPLPMMGPSFGHLGLPSGPMQPMGPNMSPGPSIVPGVLFPTFPGPLVWQGARGVDMNMVPVPPNLPPFPPPGPVGPRFSPNMGNGPNHHMYNNQPGTGRGAQPNTSAPGFNVTGPIGRETPHDKAPMVWVPQRNSGPSGKAPSRGEQNDYSQNFVDTGMRPQNFIRELELTNVVEDYPKLRELIQRKDEIVAKSSSPPMYYKCDLHEFVLSPEFFGTKFDVILVDPPWEEYVHRAPGVTDHLEYWSFEKIQNLKIEAIADNPSFIFLWVGDGVGLEQGRQCLKKWGFRRCEDICWVKTNKRNATPGLRHAHTLFQHSKEHCLMGIKGTVRRSTDGHIIHANIDTDIIIAEEPSDGSTKKPEDMYRIIEHFSLGRRRLELFGEDHNIRSGWLTVGNGLSSSNFNTEAYVRNFADKEGKSWQGGGGRNPPPDAPHLVVTTPEIESLRPKSPPPKNQQQQQQSMPLGTTGGSNSRRPSGNSPQTNPPASQSGLNQDASVSEPGTPAPWASSPMVGLRDGGHGISDDKFYEGYGFNASGMQAVGDHHEFDPRAASLM